MSTRLVPVLLLVSLFFIQCTSTRKSTTPRGGTTTTSSVMQKRQRIVGEAQDLVGSKYMYSGKSPATGFDCSGFTSYVMRQYAGVTISPASAAQAKEGRPVPLDKVLPGDIIVFGKSETSIQHVAMVVKRDKNGITCVHSTTSRGVVVENITQSTYWEPRILFARDMLTGKVR
jgi:cell wall-associated NlpC family hydrolase